MLHISKHANKIKAQESISLLLKLFQIAPVTKGILKEALGMQYSDFEYAVLYKSTQLAGVEAIVTRNKKDFKNAQLNIYSPSSLI